MKKIFISHRSLDSEIANLLVEFLTGVGVEYNTIFCSSLPGYDVDFEISSEVLEAIDQSYIYFIIYSADYYESAYCRNEEGIIWYKTKTDTKRKVITIALPEIKPQNMLGFIDGTHILRRVDNKFHVAEIYDEVIENLKSDSVKSKNQTIIQTEIEKAIVRYKDYIDRRSPKTLIIPSDLLNEMRFVEERALLYYVLETGNSIFYPHVVKKWLEEKEICNIKIENGLDLLENRGYGRFVDKQFVIREDFLEVLRKNQSLFLSLFKASVISNQQLSRDTFICMWKLGEFDKNQKLFITFLIDTKISVLNKDLKKKITEWENSNGIQTELNKDTSYLNIFIMRHLISSTDSQNTLILRKSFYEYLVNEFNEYETLEKLKNGYKIHNIIKEFHRKD